MKGGMLRRLRGMKTKSIHGVSSAHHDNPHVLRAGRASGGRCAEVEGEQTPPRLSSPMRAKGGKVGGGKVGFTNKAQAPMAPAESKSDAARVQVGMEGKDKNRAFGGKVDKYKNFPGTMQGDKKAGAGASGNRNLKGESGKLAYVAKGASSKGKDDGKETSLPKSDGTKNASGKKFASGGKTGDGKDEKSDEEEAADEEDDDEANEAAAKKVAEDAKEKAYGVRTEEGRKHGGKVKRKDGGDVDDEDSEDPRGRAQVDNMINEAPSMDEINTQLGIKPKSNVAQNGSAGLAGRKDGGKAWNPGGHPGKLHRELNIDPSKKIPAKRLAKAEQSDNPEIARDAKRAETMKKWKH